MTQEKKIGFVALSLSLVTFIVVGLLLCLSNRNYVVSKQSVVQEETTAVDENQTKTIPSIMQRTSVLPVFSSRKVAETTELLKPYIGKRIVVVGPVVHLSTTGFRHRSFWGVAEGLGVAGLSDNPSQDRPQVSCVFKAGLPINFKVSSNSLQIEGTYSGVIVTSGVPLLIDCNLKN